MTPERVESGEEVLRRAVAADAAGVLSVHGDPRVYMLDPHETLRDLDDARRFMVPLLEHWERHGFGYWTVLVPRVWWPEGEPGGQPGDDGLVQAGLGGIRFIELGGEPGLNVYFRLAPAVQRRGIAGRILAAARELAPAVGPGRDLMIRTRPGNAAVLRVAERAGFSAPVADPEEDGMLLLRLAVGD